jgi:hypothetical protein
MTLIERLKSLGKRREEEGIYTDQNICENAIEEIERMRTALKDAQTLIDNDLVGPWMAKHKLDEILK